jgi:hypothetical protein
MTYHGLSSFQLAIEKIEVIAIMIQLLLSTITRCHLEQIPYAYVFESLPLFNQNNIRKNLAIN